MVSQFKSLVDLETARTEMSQAGIETQLEDGWVYRSITRDVKWGVALPEEIDPAMNTKTLYVWPDSLIAPISFSEVAPRPKVSIQILLLNFGMIATLKSTNF